MYQICQKEIYGKFSVEHRDYRQSMTPSWRPWPIINDEVVWAKTKKSKFDGKVT